VGATETPSVGATETPSDGAQETPRTNQVLQPKSFNSSSSLVATSKSNSRRVISKKEDKRSIEEKRVEADRLRQLYPEAFQETADA